MRRLSWCWLWVLLACSGSTQEPDSGPWLLADGGGPTGEGPGPSRADASAANGADASAADAAAGQAPEDGGQTARAIGWDCHAKEPRPGDCELSLAHYRYSAGLERCVFAESYVCDDDSRYHHATLFQCIGACEYGNATGEACPTKGCGDDYLFCDARGQCASRCDSSDDCFHMQDGRCLDGACVQVCSDDEDCGTVGAGVSCTGGECVVDTCIDMGWTCGRGTYFADEASCAATCDHDCAQECDQVPPSGCSNTSACAACPLPVTGGMPPTACNTSGLICQYTASAGDLVSCDCWDREGHERQWHCSWLLGP